MSIEELEDEDLNLNISLNVGSGNLSVAYLTRRMAFDEAGYVMDEQYVLNPTADFDEETIQLLKDTMRGMEARLNHLLLKNRNKENA